MDRSITKFFFFWDGNWNSYWNLILWFLSLRAVIFQLKYILYPLNTPGNLTVCEDMFDCHNLMVSTTGVSKLLTISWCTVCQPPPHNKELSSPKCQLCWGWDTLVAPWPSGLNQRSLKHGKQGNYLHGLSLCAHQPLLVVYVHKVHARCSFLTLAVFIFSLECLLSASSHPQQFPVSYLSFEMSSGRGHSSNLLSILQSVWGVSILWFHIVRCHNEVLHLRYWTLSLLLPAWVWESYGNRDCQTRISVRSIW